MRFWQKLKEISWDWLPLSGLVMIVYMIQRGFMAISKGGFTDIDIKAAMGVFFTATALFSVVIGFLADRVKAQNIVALAGITGTLGILALGYNTWAFGILMGLTAAVAKMIPFSAPLKRLTSKWDALRITPQAVAKTVGKAAFMFLLAATLKTMGFSQFTWIAAPIFAFLGWSAYVLVKRAEVEPKIIKWDLESVKATLMNWKWYLLAGTYAIAAVGYYTIVPSIVPGLVGLGQTKTNALLIFGTGMMLLAPLRWAWAWLGDVTKGHQAIYLGYSACWVAGAFLVPMYPLIGIPAFMIISKCATPNFWVTAKKWLGEKYLGTGVGMAFIVTYLTIGCYLGKW